MEGTPIYVKVDKYKELTQVLKAINTKLQNIDRTITKINELKAQEDEQMRKWTENVADIRGRLERINDAFYEG